MLFVRDVDLMIEELCRMLDDGDLRGLVGHKAAGIGHHAARLAAASAAPQHALERPTPPPNVEEGVRR